MPNVGTINLFSDSDSFSQFEMSRNPGPGVGGTEVAGGESD